MHNELTIKQKLINYYYFVIFNSILACIIGIGYWFVGPVNYNIIIPKLTDWLAISYIVTTHFLVITLITFLVSVVILPTLYLSPKKTLIIQSILASLFIGILIFDVGIYHADSMHIINIETVILADTLCNIGIMFTKNKIIAYIAFIFFIILIYFINKWIYKTSFLINNKIATKFNILITCFLLISIITYKLQSEEKQQQLLAYIRYLPINLSNNKNNNIDKLVTNGKIQYPLKPLQTTNVSNPPNILIIGIDAWRADCFNATDSPNLWQFAKQGKIFTNHFSGGNHTYTGLFSLFYGNPAVYFYKFKRQKIPALLFTQLKKLNYNLNCFAENGNYDWLSWFIQQNNLSKLDDNIIRAYQKDSQITNNWLSWYKNLEKTQPWFSFVFYDSLHGPDFPEGYSKINKLPENGQKYKNFAAKYGKDNFIKSYKTAVHYIDSRAAKILQHLEANNDLANTIVIITADHGCEWDDNNQGQYGYWSNFTNCQIQVPLAIIYPQHDSFNKQDIENKLTTHYDIAPTLMKNFLGVDNNISDYSIGNDLTSNFSDADWNLVASEGQYTSGTFVIVEKNKITKFNFNLNKFITDKFNNPLFNEKINIDYLNKAINSINRFIKY